MEGKEAGELSEEETEQCRSCKASEAMKVMVEREAAEVLKQGVIAATSVERLSPLQFLLPEPSAWTPSRLSRKQSSCMPRAAEAFFDNFPCSVQNEVTSGTAQTRQLTRKTSKPSRCSLSRERQSYQRG